MNMIWDWIILTLLCMFHMLILLLDRSFNLSQMYNLIFFPLSSRSWIFSHVILFLHHFLCLQRVHCVTQLSNLISLLLWLDVCAISHSYDVFSCSSVSVRPLIMETIFRWDLPTFGVCDNIRKLVADQKGLNMKINYNCSYLSGISIYLKFSMEVL